MTSFKPFSDWSIRSKMTSIILGISVTGLLVFTLIFVLVELNMTQKQLVENLTVLAESVAQTSTAAITFLDRQSATHLLQALSADSDIITGAIITPDNTVFAYYPDHAKIPIPSNYSGSRFLFEQKTLSLEIFHPIMLNDEVIAHLHIHSSLTKAKQQGKYLLLIMLLDFLLVLALVMLTSRRSQHFIIRPISKLAETMATVTEQGTYRVQAKTESKDEIGQLVASFNTMLSVIQTRDEELQIHRYNLELQVEKRTEELKQKHDEALHLTQAKSEFLAHISHELRTPMNAIIGMGHLLDRTQLTTQQQDYLNTQLTASNLLLNHINNVLDFSKLEAGKIQLNSNPFQLSTLWSQLSSLFQTRATSKGLQLHFPDPEVISETLLGDLTRLTQIMINLLDNAIKFTDSGNIHIDTEIVVRNKAELLLRFSVRDSGTGIHASQIEQLFQPFSQITPNQQQPSGTGLGLAICKQLVTAMNGTLGISSEPGHGSLFSFTVQLATSPHQSIQNTAPTLPQNTISTQALNNFHILLVEDTAANRLVVEGLLDMSDIPVTSVESGTAALKIIEQQLFDLILMDIQMPGINGCETTKLIRQNTHYKTVPIIAMTAHALSGDRKHFLDNGMDDYLAKPFYPAQLEQILNKWLQPQAYATKTAKPKLNSPLPLALPMGFNLAQGLESVDQNTELYKQTLQLFIEDYRNAAEKIMLALDSNNIRESKRLLHSLIGASAMIGWVKISEIARNLQDLLKNQELQTFNQQLEVLNIAINQAIPALQRLGYLEPVDQTSSVDYL